jgi:hypothetical protein
MFKDIYFYRARFFPALLTCIPMLVFFNKILAVRYYDAMKNVFEVLPVIAHLGLSAAVIFLCVQINRFLGKEIFQRFYFRQDSHMPTTSFLLWNNDYYDETIKVLIRDKILSKYGIALLNVNDELQNEKRARGLIVVAVSQIKNALKDNKTLFQHNLEYGFCRNLIGGCVLAVTFAAIIFLYGYFNSHEGLKVFGIISFLVYLLPIVLSKLIVHSYGRYYGKVLYEQFLSL